MKFTIDQKLLHTNLQFLSKATPQRSTMPIIGCGLFKINKDILNIRTTDLEITISKNCKIINGEDGSIA